MRLLQNTLGGRARGGCKSLQLVSKDQWGSHLCMNTYPIQIKTQGKQDMNKNKKAPEHLREDTAKWWEQVATDYELEPHHLRLLTLAAESWDRCQQLCQHCLTTLLWFCCGSLSVCCRPFPKKLPWQYEESHMRMPCAGLEPATR